MIPVEVKLGRTANPSKVRSLTQFVKEHQAPYGLLINNALESCWINPYVAQIPLKYL